MTDCTEKRGSILRRDINDLVRDESCKVSPAKIGGIAGQVIAGQYLVVHWELVIASWDILSILLSVLIAPDLFKKLMTMKYGGKDDKPTVTTVAAATVTTVSADAHSAPSKGRSRK